MTKYWIDPAMKLRANEKGFPDRCDFEERLRLEDEYLSALDQAKQESLIIEGYEVNPAWEHAKPDSFVELSIEVEFDDRWETKFGYGKNVRWEEIEERDIDQFKENGGIVRCVRICRVKRTENEVPESAVVGSGMYFPEIQIADLTGQLEAANKRIKELEGSLADMIMSPVSVLERLESFTKSGPQDNRYEFNLQVWGAGNNNVFITKGDVEMWSGGGYDTATEALLAALAYMKRVKAKTGSVNPEV